MRKLFQIMISLLPTILVAKFLPTSTMVPSNFADFLDKREAAKQGLYLPNLYDHREFYNHHL